MPIYNGIEFIDESVSTVLYQSFKEWELMIGINGHEKDSSVYTIAKQYENKDPRIRVIDYYTICGKSNTLNKMVKEAKYNWIALLDVDDKWLPNKLKIQKSYMKHYDIIGTNCKYFGDLNISPNIPFGDLNTFNFLRFNPIINSSCLLKKELCIWNPYEDGVEDYNLWLSLWKKNKKFYNVSEIQVLHRIHKNSAFNANQNNLKAKRLITKYK